VASIVDLEEGEAVGSAGGTSLLTIDVPVMVLGGVETLVAIPWEGKSPGLVAHPVTDEISIAGVDEHLDSSFKHRREGVLLSLHPVIGKLLVDLHVARFPGGGGGGDTKSFTGGVEAKPSRGSREVVTQARNLALDADVIGVEPGCFVWSDHFLVALVLGLTADRGVVLALVDELDAAWSLELHSHVGEAADGFHIVSVLVRHIGVILVLNGWIGETVSNSDTLEVDLREAVVGLIAFEHGVGNIWGVVPP